MLIYVLRLHGMNEEDTVGVRVSDIDVQVIPSHFVIVHSNEHMSAGGEGNQLFPL